MTIGNALGFIERGLNDIDFRKRINSAQGPENLKEILKAEDLLFTDHHFDEAWHNRLIKCQEAEDGERLKEFKLWWELTSSSFAKPG